MPGFNNHQTNLMLKKNIFVFAAFFSLLISPGCGSNNSDNNGSGDSTASTSSNEAAGASNDAKGIGPIRNVELTHPLDEAMLKKGQEIYEVKCQSCHKLTDEKLVGPGWKGVTDRRTPEWIMNFIVNTEEMISKDTAAQNMLEQCLVRMPNQNLSEQDARDVLELMRKNDGKN